MRDKHPRHPLRIRLPLGAKLLPQTPILPRRSHQQRSHLNSRPHNVYANHPAHRSVRVPHTTLAQPCAATERAETRTDFHEHDACVAWVARVRVRPRGDELVVRARRVQEREEASQRMKASHAQHSACERERDSPKESGRDYAKGRRWRQRAEGIEDLCGYER